MNEAIAKERITFNVNEIRTEFPILQQEINGNPLVYFDNAATTQKPKIVIDAISEYYTSYNANIHRGIHTLAEKATSQFEATRKTVQRFINASETEEIVFTSGTTESINLVASSYGNLVLEPGDEVIISSMEHHSNIVPWQLICEAKGAKLKVIPVTADGELDLESFYNLLSPKTKIVSIVYVSNTLGTINPVKDIIEAAHQQDAVVMLDGAQATPHLEIDVQELDADFFAFSGHKMYGPLGVGILYGKRDLLESMPPYQGGGEMISEVSFEKTTYNDIPYKFEAGTPNIGDVVALQHAINFLARVNKKLIQQHENELMAHAYESLMNIKGFKPIGVAKKKASVISFVLENVHHFDVGMMLDARGIAVRTGHHCTQPLMRFLEIEGTVRASFAVYNTKKEIDQLAESLDRIVKKLNK